MKHRFLPDVSGKFFAEYVKPKPGCALIVGSYVVENKIDRRTLYPEAIGVDMREGPGVDVVADLEHPPGLGMFEHVDCVSVLEHVQRPWKMAEVLEGLLVPGGTIFVSVPWVWKVHSYPSDYWRFSPECIKFLFPSIDWQVIRYVYTELSESMPAQLINGYRWYPRTEVVAFGIRK